LVELLVVMAIVAILLSITIGSSGMLSAPKGVTAVQGLIATLDSARAKALGGSGPVWIAFADGGVFAPVPPFQAYVVCTEQTEMVGTTSVTYLSPIAAWENLPDGLVFCPTAPALPEAGENLASVDAALKREVRMGDRKATLPCLAFGPLGEVVHPVASAKPVLLAIAEGFLNGTTPVMPNGQPPDAARCRWVAIHRNTGKSIPLP
jgi:type II secretory pathway pseudopilin PulG